MSWRVWSRHWSRHSSLVRQRLEVVGMSSGRAHVLVLLPHAEQVERGVGADVLLGVRD